jgi:glutamate dehydrogenase (NAD(P)+)
VDVLGPKKDVPAPDVNTTPEIMAWMADEYAKLTGDSTGATFTGKPVEKGGSEGRGQATGLGGFYVFDKLRAEIGLPQKCKVVIQGFGNVGGNAARIFAEHGHTVIAVSDSRGGIFKTDGLDYQKLEEYKKKTGGLKNFPGAQNITNEKLLGLPCDLLVPAAFENVINEKNANNIKAKVVLELANGPVTPEADEILFKKNILVVPDILANSGGVTVSYFEWDQNLKGEHWNEKKVLANLKKHMEKASKEILATAKKFKTSLRIGAFILALERIQKKL